MFCVVAQLASMDRGRPRAVLAVVEVVCLAKSNLREGRASEAHGSQGECSVQATTVREVRCELSVSTEGSRQLEMPSQAEGRVAAEAVLVRGEERGLDSR
jgi:hypothetical protein